MRRILLVLAVLLGLTAPAAAQVAYSTSGSAQDVSGASTTVSIGSVDCSGANTACHVAFTYRQNAGQTFSGFTHSGSSFTTLQSLDCPGGGGGCLVTAYVCNGGGSGTLTATISANSSGGLFLAYTKLTGVDCAGTPVGTTTLTDSAGGAATSVTTNVTTNANGMAADALYLRDEGTTNVPTVGQTQRQTTALAGSQSLWTSTKPHTATSLGWTWTVEGSLNFVHSVTPFNAAAGGGGGTAPQLMLRGVGDAAHLDLPVEAPRPEWWATTPVEAPRLSVEAPRQE